MNKGFTLIELLAVIVILAIIAIIATPIILGIIDDVKVNSAIESSRLYVDGLGTRLANSYIFDNSNPSMCTINNGVVTCDGTVIQYTTTGDKPIDGYISYNNGVVLNYSMIISGYKVVKTNNITATKVDSNDKSFGGTYVEPGVNDTHLGIVYLDPINLSNECTLTIAAGNVDSTTHLPTGVNTGCMKFYIYYEDSNNYRLILDHNTSGDVAWNSNSGTTMEEVKLRLLDDTKGWAGEPRIISANEIAHIVGIDTTLLWDSNKPWGVTKETQSAWYYLDGSGDNYYAWEVGVANTNNKSSYAWLYDYTSECIQYGCNYEDNNVYSYETKDNLNKDRIYGYWTSDMLAGTTEYAWRLIRDGSMNYYFTNYPSLYGVRPVITLPKTLIR